MLSNEVQYKKWKKESPYSVTDCPLFPKAY